MDAYGIGGHTLCDGRGQGLPRGQDPAHVLGFQFLQRGATADLDVVVTHALAAGASVRLIGDDQQLASVSAGGVLKDLADRYGALTLSTVIRFTDPELGAAEGAAGSCASGGAFSACACSSVSIAKTSCGSVSFSVGVDCIGGPLLNVTRIRRRACFAAWKTLCPESLVQAAHGQ